MALKKTTPAAAPKATAKATKTAAPAKASPAKGKLAATAGKATATDKIKTVTLKDLASDLTTTHDMLTKKQAESVLSELVDKMTEHLRDGSRIRIGKLGILQVKSRAARMGRNPATGAAIEIKASKKVAFRPAKDLKDAI